MKQKRKGKQLYYARVSYDVDKKEFFDYSSIDFLCLCVQPKNPDRTFIACEYFDESGRKSGGCGALYHFHGVLVPHERLLMELVSKMPVMCAQGERKRCAKQWQQCWQQWTFAVGTSNWRKQKFLPNWKR